MNGLSNKQFVLDLVCWLGKERLVDFVSSGNWELRSNLLLSALCVFLRQNRESVELAIKP